MTKTYALAISYEFETRSPETWRGTIEAGNPATALARGERLARKALKPRQWTSMVAVVSLGAS